jgi:hypothetical protein
MSETLILKSLDELRRYVQHVICDREHLVAGAFEFIEQVLERHGHPCGLHFTLNGPRCVQCSAIWDAIRHTILFYDCTGERFHRTDLKKPSQLHFELANCYRDTACSVSR